MPEISTNNPGIRQVVNACCDGASSLTQMLAQRLRTGRRCSGCVGGCDQCRVPRPFWWPQKAAEVTSHVCPGGVATVQVVVQNLGPRVGEYQVGVLPTELGKHASVSEPSFRLLPFQRQRVSVSFLVPGDTAIGQAYEPMIWVIGCLNHVILWRVVAAKLSTTVCNEVDIKDAPEYEHHWYDHFYCEHPCKRG